MQWTSSGDATHLILILRGERRRSDILHFVLVGICIVGLHYCSGDEIARVIGRTLGFLWALGVLLRQQFGTSTLCADADSITLDRRTLGLGRTRKFLRTDTERLGYEPEVNSGNISQDAALALMVRVVMMPIRFAHGTKPDEAEAIFKSIKESGSWLGTLIRPVGAPMF